MLREHFFDEKDEKTLQDMEDHIQLIRKRVKENLVIDETKENNSVKFYDAEQARWANTMLNKFRAFIPEMEALMEKHEANGGGYDTLAMVCHFISEKWGSHF